MNLKTTRWLVIIALSMAGYILVFEKGNRLKKRTEEEAQKVLPDFDSRLVSAMEISFRTNPVVRVERGTNGGWQLNQPVSYPALEDPVEALLKAFGELTRRATLGPKDIAAGGGGLSAFGLEPPAARVVLLKGTVRTEIRIGSKSPLGDALYVQRNGSESVDIVSAAILSQLPGNPVDWRDPALVSFDRVAVDRLEVRSDGAFYELQLDQTNRQWRLTKPIAARANSLRVDTLLRLLEESRVAAFVSDSPGAAMDSFGLVVPQMELSLAKGSNLLAQVLFGQHPTNRQDYVHARLAGRTNVVLVARELVDHFRPPHTRFRETRLVPFPAAAADMVEVVGNKENFAMRRMTNGSWRVMDPHNFDADSGLVQRLLETLGSLEVSDFVQEVVTDFSLFGISPTNRQITVRSGPTNAVMAQLQLGSVYQANRIYARRADESALYAVRLADALQLPNEAFELRDRQLWRFTTDQVMSVSISLRGQNRKISRGPGGGWVVSPAYATVTAAMFEEALHRLGDLKALSWVAKGDDKLGGFGFPDVAHQLSIEVRTGDKSVTHTLNFGQNAPWNSPYASTSLGGQTLIFGIPAREVYDLYELVLRELKLVSPTP